MLFSFNIVISNKIRNYTDELGSCLVTGSVRDPHPVTLYIYLRYLTWAPKFHLGPLCHYIETEKRAPGGKFKAGFYNLI